MLPDDLIEGDLGGKMGYLGRKRVSSFGSG